MEPSIFRNDESGRSEFKALAQRAIDWLVDYYKNIEDFPVRSLVSPGDIYKRFPDVAPSGPVDQNEVFRILNEVLLHGMTHWQHPNFYAFFPGNTSFPSIAAEILTAGLAAQCMLWESSPSAAELEQRMMEWCRELLGLPSEWSGVIQDTASTATLTALLTAREWKSGFRISKRGFDATTYRIYTSSQAHSSVEKAVRLAGFGTDNLVAIEVDETLALKPEHLTACIKDDLKEGFVPVAVVSTIGTTSTGAIDPVDAVSSITSQYGLWHHVDAAYLGTGFMLDEYSQLKKGLEGADSFVFNPHKWMFVQFDCSAYFVREPELLVRTMGITPSYLATSFGDRVNDYRDWGIPLGRRFRALKLWMTIQLLGTDAIKERLRHHIHLAKKVEQFISADSRLEIAYPRSLNIVTFRIIKSFDPDGKLIKRLINEVNESGKAYMTHSIVQEKGLGRWVTGQTYLEERHLDSTWEVIQSILSKIIVA
jgi:aromatic-L-amino-acid decarboxylase